MKSLLLKTFVLIVVFAFIGTSLAIAYNHTDRGAGLNGNSSSIPKLLALTNSTSSSGYVKYTLKASQTSLYINSVSPIIAKNKQLIYINGSGFGYNPQTYTLFDSSVDTVSGGSTPYMTINDNGGGSYSWQAGVSGDAIGIYINNWTNTQIILSGFGSALTTGTGRYNIKVGDPIAVSVFNPQISSVGASYNLSVTYSYAQGWNNITSILNNIPNGAGMYSMTWDYAMHSLLLFGGSSASGLSNSLLSFSNYTWHNITPLVSPSPRDGASMAYNSDDGYVLLFGGQGGSYTLNDTWIFENMTWKKVNTNTVPPPSYDACLAYDPSSNAFILFGGNSGSTYYNNTWEFKNYQWYKINTSVSPVARSGAEMVYDPQINGLLLFGGTTNWAYSGTGLSDTWEFVNNTWVQLSPATVPVDRDNFAMSYDPSLGGVLLFGGWVPSGSCGYMLNDTWLFSNNNWTQLNINYSPSIRQASRMVYDPSTNGVVLFGGFEQSCGTSTSYLNDTWVYYNTSSTNTNKITYTEVGLPSGTNWWVNLSGNNRSSTGSSITFSVVNGTYSYTIGSVTGYTVTPSSGSETVNGTNVSVSVTFKSKPTVTPSKYTVTFTESGLASGTSWSVTLSGKTQSSTTGTITFTEVNGTYSYTVANVSGYTVSPLSGSVTVNGTNASVSVTFKSTTTTPVTSSSGIFIFKYILYVIWALFLIGGIAVFTRVSQLRTAVKRGDVANANKINSIGLGVASLIFGGFVTGLILLVARTHTERASGLARYASSVNMNQWRQQGQRAGAGTGYPYNQAVWPGVQNQIAINDNIRNEQKNAMTMITAAWIYSLIYAIGFTIWSIISIMLTAGFISTTTTIATSSGIFIFRFFIFKFILYVIWVLFLIGGIGVFIRVSQLRTAVNRWDVANANKINSIGLGVASLIFGGFVTGLILLVARTHTERASGLARYASSVNMNQWRQQGQRAGAGTGYPYNQAVWPGVQNQIAINDNIRNEQKNAMTMITAAWIYSLIYAIGFTIWSIISIMLTAGFISTTTTIATSSGIFIFRFVLYVIWALFLIGGIAVLTRVSQLRTAVNRWDVANANKINSIGLGVASLIFGGFVTGLILLVARTHTERASGLARYASSVNMNQWRQQGQRAGTGTGYPYNQAVWPGVQNQIAINDSIRNEQKNAMTMITAAWIYSLIYAIGFTIWSITSILGIISILIAVVLIISLIITLISVLLVLLSQQVETTYANPLYSPLPSISTIPTPSPLIKSPIDYHTSIPTTLSTVDLSDIQNILANINANIYDNKNAILKLGKIMEEGQGGAVAEQVVKAWGISSLVNSLSNKDVSVRRSAILTIGSVAEEGQYEAVAEQVASVWGIPTVVSCLFDKDINVRRSAALTIGKIAEGGKAEAIADEVIKVKGVIHLLDLLSDSNAKVCKNAAYALTWVAKGGHAEDVANEVVKGGGLPLLITLLKHDTPDIKKAVTLLIGWIANGGQVEVIVRGGCVPLLINLLTDNDAEVRKSAVWTLGKIVNGGQVEAVVGGLGLGVPPLINLLTDNDVETRENVVWTLGKIVNGGQVEAVVGGLGLGVPLLINLLTDNDAEVRKSAAWTLGKIANKGHVEVLIKNVGVPRLVNLLTDNDAEVRETTAFALGWIAKGGQAEEITRSGGIPYLIKLLSDNNTNVREYTALALGWIAKGGQAEEITRSGGIPYLIKLLSDKSDTVRGNASTALGWIAKGGQAEEITRSGGIPYLIKLLSDSNTNVRESTALALGWIAKGGQAEEITRSGGVSQLIKLLSDGDVNVRIEATSVIGRFATMKIVHGGSIDLLNKCLKDDNLILREKAAEVIGKIAEVGIADESSVKLLEDCLKDEYLPVRRNAEHSLDIIKKIPHELLSGIKNELIDRQEIVEYSKELFKDQLKKLYTFENIIYNERFNYVYTAKKNSEDQLRIVKIADKVNDQEGNVFNNEKNVIEIFEESPHRNIYLFENKTLTYMDGNWINGKKLEEIINESTYGYTVKDLGNIFYNIIDACDYANHKGIIFCNLQPSYVFVPVDETQQKVNVEHLKIINLGGCYIKKSANRSVLEAKLWTKPWAPPELTEESEQLSEKTMSYMIGIMIYWVFTGKYLYSFGLEHKQDIKNGIISDKLIEIFNSSSHPLHSNSKISPVNDNTWKVEDGGNIYKIKDTGTQLYLYDMNSLEKDILEKLEDINNERSDMHIDLLKMLDEENTKKLIKLIMDSTSNIDDRIGLLEMKRRINEIFKLEKKVMLYDEQGSNMKEDIYTSYQLVKQLLTDDKVKDIKDEFSKKRISEIVQTYGDKELNEEYKGLCKDLNKLIERGDAITGRVNEGIKRFYEKLIIIL